MSNGDGCLAKPVKVFGAVYGIVGLKSHSRKTKRNIQWHSSKRQRLFYDRTRAHVNIQVTLLTG